MPKELTIEFDLGRDIATLRTPFSHAEFSDTETGRAMLFRALRANAQYLTRRERLGATDAGRDVSDAVLAYDRAELAKMARKFDESGKLILNMQDLEIEL